MKVLNPANRVCEYHLGGRESFICTEKTGFIIIEVCPDNDVYLFNYADKAGVLDTLDCEEFSCSDPDDKLSIQAAIKKVQDF